MTTSLAILTWPVLVVQLLILGTAVFALLFPPVALGDLDGAYRVVTVWRALAILNLAISPMLFMQIASGMAGTNWREALPLLPRILRETVAGRFWMWRFAAVMMLAIAMWSPIREGLIAFSALALSIILILLSSLTSHAIDKGALIIAMDFVHQCAGGLWFGALASLLMSASGGADAIAAFAPRVSMVCGWSLAIVAISGVATAFQWLGWNPHLLFDSAYGRALMWKVAIAAPLVLLGAHNRYRQLPRVEQPSARVLLIRSVTLECILLLAVVAWSAILANTPPPH